MKKLLIVGSGITGAYTIDIIKRSKLLGWKILLWDKARGPGGRFSTSRYADLPNCTVDLGAQYFSPTEPQYEKFKKLYLQLETDGILAPLKSDSILTNKPSKGIQHYYARNGASSIVKHLLKNSDVDVLFNHEVQSIEIIHANQLSVTTANGESEVVDALVLTMPAPQVLKLSGDVTQIIEKQSNLRSQLEKVTFSSRFAVGLFYTPDATWPYDWSMRYIDNNQCVRYIAADNIKRNQKESPLSVCVHTSVPFGLAHLEMTLDQVQPIIMKHLKEVLPDLPTPSHIKCHKWRYSQIFQGFEGTPGSICLSESPPIFLAGDSYMSDSGLNYCLESADSLSAQLLPILRH